MPGKNAEERVERGVKELHAQGASLLLIRDTLREQGIKCSHQTVANILARRAEAAA
jgi:hypothetical protein